MAEPQPRDAFQGFMNALTSIAFMFLLGGVVTCVWDVLVFCTPLRRWFRLLPPFDFKGMAFGLALFVALCPFLYFGPIANQGPGFAFGFVGFLTTGVVVALLRYETKCYLYGLAVQIAHLQNYIEANGGSIGGSSQSVGADPRPQAGRGEPPELPATGLTPFRVFKGWKPREDEPG